MKQIMVHFSGSLLKNTKKAALNSILAVLVYWTGITVDGKLQIIFHHIYLGWLDAFLKWDDYYNWKYSTRCLKHLIKSKIADTSIVGAYHYIAW